MRYKGIMPTFDVINPATSAVLDRAPDATVDDARQAIDKSVTAFVSWKAKTAFERSAILRKWYELILGDEATLARLMTQEMGKPISEPRGEVEDAAAFVEWVRGRSQARMRRHRPDPRRQQAPPGNPATGWSGLRRHAVEFPGSHGDAQSAPALAAGCTVVLKPAEQSPLTAIRLKSLAEGGRTCRSLPARTTSSTPAGLSLPTRACVSSPSRAALKSASSCTRRPPGP
jgi:succinate-semialdehyde dehydrogenase/glutarate-semialdehyde dehydrogenase